MPNPLRGNDLVRYILLDRRSHSLSQILRGWFVSCERFETFADLYKDKIRKKVRDAKMDQDLDDLQFELQAPYLLLLDRRFTVEYEKYGSGPDFYVTFEERMNFNVEVKRIREAMAGTRFDSCMDEIIETIEAIPSKLAFWLDAPGLESTLDLVDRLERSKEAVISFIADMVRSQEEKLAPNSHREYPIPGFEGELVLDLTKPLNKRDPGTSYHGGTRPIFYSKNEYRKFGDVILGCLRQLMPGMINVLFIGSDSSTHEEWNMFEAIEAVNRSLSRGDDEFFSKKGFAGRQDFLRLSRGLSAIAFRSIWIPPTASGRDRNCLWLNRAAEHPIPEEICEYLRRMTWPNRPLFDDGL